MDGDVKLKVQSLNNRISGLRTRLKRATDETVKAEIQQRLDALIAEREELAPKKERPAATTPRAPARDKEDEIGARRTLTAATLRLAHRDAPLIEALIKHAERYGTEQVVESAIDLGYPLEACVRLQDALDRIDAANHRKAHPHAPAMRFGDAETRVRAKMALVDKEPPEQEDAAA